MSTSGGNEPTSRQVRDDRPESGTTTGAETTARMTGMHKTDHDAGTTDDGFRNSDEDGFRNSDDDGRTTDDSAHPRRQPQGGHRPPALRG